MDFPSLQDTPVRYCPDVQDAAVARHRDLAWLNVATLIQDRSIFGLSHGEGPIVRHEKLTGGTEVFLKNPRSRFVRMPHDYLSFCRIAGPIFAELPDRAENGISKFDRFCNRLSIPVDRRASVRATVAKRIVDTIPGGIPNLRAVIRKTLQDADFLDDASFEEALLMLRNKTGRILS